MKEELHSLSFVVLLVLTFGFTSFILSAYSLSPSFVRQEVNDNPEDIFDFRSNQFGCVQTEPTNDSEGYNRPLDKLDSSARSPSTEIGSVSYSSDGRFLNGTIWLIPPSSEFTNKTTNQALIYSSSQNITTPATLFTMAIDVHSSFDNGNDYKVEIYSDKPGSGIKEISETSFTGDSKVLSRENASNFYNGSLISHGTGHVNFDFDLALANYPKEYSISFDTSKAILVNGTSHICFDNSANLPVPPPDLLINASVNPVYLRPGEEKQVILNVRSKADIVTNLEFNYNHSSAMSHRKPVLPDGINFKINPSNLTLFPMGGGLTTLTINSTEDTLPQSFTVPIPVKISLPKLYPPKEYNSTFSSFRFLFERQTLTTVTNDYFLTITLLPKLSFDEWLNDAVSRWVSPFSALWTFLAGIGAVVAPLVIRMYTRKKKKESADKVWY